MKISDFYIFRKWLDISCHGLITCTTLGYDKKDPLLPHPPFPLPHGVEWIGPAAKKIIIMMIIIIIIIIIGIIIITIIILITSIVKRIIKIRL